MTATVQALRGQGNSVTGQTRYLPGGVTCPGKFDSNSTDRGYIGALLFGVSCDDTHTVSAWRAFYPEYDGHSTAYVGCAGDLFLLYNDVPGEYSDDSGAYSVTVVQTVSTE